MLVVAMVFRSKSKILNQSLPKICHIKEDNEAKTKGCIYSGYSKKTYRSFGALCYKHLASLKFKKSFFLKHVSFTIKFPHRQD